MIYLSQYGNQTPNPFRSHRQLVFAVDKVFPMSGGHHLILGELIDYITARPLPDTHDERYRQKIARLLVGKKGYAKTDIIPQYPLQVRADDKCARVPVDFVVQLDEHIAMIIHYGPGSLVTRHRPTLAMGRLVSPYQVPVVVVTNGEQADILDGAGGKLLDNGLQRIPDRRHLSEIMHAGSWPSIPPRQAEMEARIVMAFEVDDRCPCDDTVCTLARNGDLA